MRVALLVTGKMEQVGLPLALKRLFPAHEFECVPHGPSGHHYHSFTSNPLPIPPLTGGIRTTIDVLIADAAGLASQTRPEGPDLVVILDDLELANADQPGLVVNCFLASVRAHLDKLQPRISQATQSALRNKMSLHFAVPMIESWLFADPGGLDRVKATSPRLAADLSCGASFENFSTCDADYLEDDCSGCEHWARARAHGGRMTKSKRRANEPEWCRDSDVAVRSRHPKRYIAWLCRDPQTKKCSTYRERDAAAALGELDWSALAERASMPFLYSLIDDLAHGLNEDCTLAQSAVLEPRTRLKSAGHRVLRNM